MQLQGGGAIFRFGVGRPMGLPTVLLLRQHPTVNATVHTTKKHGQQQRHMPLAEEGKYK
jgi:hypothetical protein